MKMKSYEQDKSPFLYQRKEGFYNIIHNNFVGLLQVRQIQCNFIRVIISITQKLLDILQ